MNPRVWNWKWIFWQVAAPILGPIIISAAAGFAWQSGASAFKVDWAVILDVSPWALTFYAITLIGATMDGLWSKLGNHSILGSSLIVLALSVAIYAAFIVIWRHDPAFKPGAAVYAVTFILLGISVILCHQASKL